MRVLQDPFAGLVGLQLQPRRAGGALGSSSPRWTGWAGFSESGNVFAVTLAWPGVVVTCSDPELFCLLRVPCPLPPPALEICRLPALPSSPRGEITAALSGAAALELGHTRVAAPFWQDLSCL